MKAIQNTLHEFLRSFSGTIQKAAGFVEVYHAFSTLNKESDWERYCHENILEIYTGAEDFLNRLKNEVPVEYLWPLLDDLSFHSAIFSCYFTMFDFLLDERLLQNGVSTPGSPEFIANYDSTSAESVMTDTVLSFKELMCAFEKQDLVGQKKYLKRFYMNTSQIQLIAACSNLDS